VALDLRFQARIAKDDSGSADQMFNWRDFAYRAWITAHPEVDGLKVARSFLTA
jgi:hypothetical protein